MSRNGRLCDCRTLRVDARNIAEDCLLSKETSARRQVVGHEAEVLRHTLRLLDESREVADLLDGPDWLVGVLVQFHLDFVGKLPPIVAPADALEFEQIAPEARIAATRRSLRGGSPRECVAHGYVGPSAWAESAVKCAAPHVNACGFREWFGATQKERVTKAGGRHELDAHHGAGRFAVRRASCWGDEGRPQRIYQHPASCRLCEHGSCSKLVRLHSVPGVPNCSNDQRHFWHLRSAEHARDTCRLPDDKSVFTRGTQVNQRHQLCWFFMGCKWRM